MRKKLTITDLIAQKEALKQRKAETVEIETGLGTITICMPHKAVVAEAVEIGKAGGDEYLVYECVKEPNLKDKKLQEAFDCVEPIDIINKVFKPGEVAAISTLLMQHAGYQNGKIDFVKKTDEAIKN